MFYSKYTMLVGASKSISGFDPRSIPGCSLWLDGADTATMNSTPTVTTWTDKSGQGNNVVGTATYSSGTITFNGTNQAFSNTTYVFPSNAYSMFAVYSNTTAPGATSYMNVVYGNGGYPMLGVYGSSKFVSARSVVANTGALSPNIVASNVLVGATYTPSTFSPFINGSAETTLAGTTLAATGIYVGGPTNYFNGSVSEILIYSATLTQTQRQSVEGYLAWKWGLQVQVPAPGLTPLSVPGCALWLDGSDTTTFTFSSGSNISNWKDKSGLSNNATAYNTPVLTANAINGKQAISTSNLPYFGGSISVTGTTVTIFCVATTTRTLPNGGSDQRLVSLGNGANVDYGRTDGVIGLFNQSSSSWIGTWRVSGPIASNAIVTNTPFLAVSKYDGTNGYLWMNGVAGTLASSASTGTFAVTKYGIGNQANPTAEYWQGYIGEVIIYSNALSDTERQNIEKYLSNKWSITISSGLPTTHPFYSLPAFSRPFGPLDIPGCSLWLDAADASTIAYSGSSVTSIKEKANGVTLTTQGTSSFLTTPAASIGSLQALWFNNSNAQNVYLSGTFQSVLTGSAFMVWKSLVQNGSANFFPIFTWWTGGGTFPAYGYVSTSTLTVAPYTTYGGLGTPATTTVANTDYLAFYSWSGTTPTVGINGAAPTSGTQPAFSSSTTAFRVGSDTGTATNMYLGELIIFNSVLGTTQRQQVEGYLAAKWGLLNNLPGKTLSPLNIPGCVLWLDASDSSTLTLSSGNMTQWTDKSGVGNTMTAYSTYSNVTVSSGFQNGLNALNFSGGGVYRTPASSAVYPLDMYAVVALKDLTTVVDVLGMGATSTDNFNSLTFGERTTGRWHNGSSSFLRTPNCVSPTNETVSNSLVLIQWLIADSNYLLRRNGTQLVQTSSYTFTLTAGSVFQLGLRYPWFTTGPPSNPFRGYIGEILIFSNVLDTSQRQSVENYLMSKWGISNVTSHPFKSIPPSTSQPPQFQEVTPGNWTYDWQPYLQRLTAANSGATASIGTSITPSVKCGFAATLAPNGNLYSYGWDVTGITVVNTTTNTIVTTITGTTTFAYFSSCLGPDGNIYCSPYCAATVCVIYPATNTFSTSAITMLSTPNSTPPNGSYCASVLGPNGKIYCIPRAYAISCSIGIIDTVAKTFNIMPSAVVTANQGYIGGVLAPNGKIYCIPFVDSGSVSVGIIDPVANTFTTMPSSSVSTVGAYNGGVLAPNGKIYCIPYNATNVGIIDPVANTFNTTTITNAPGSAAYTGGCLGPNGKIYFAPRSATAFGVVDPVANTLTTTGGVSGTSGTGYTGAFLTSAGKFYCPNVNTAVVNVVNFSSLNQTPSPNYCLSAYTNKS